MSKTTVVATLVANGMTKVATAFISICLILAATAITSNPVAAALQIDRAFRGAVEVTECLCKLSLGRL